MLYNKHIKNISSINNEFRYYKTIESLFELDQWSSLPSEGGAYRQQVAAHIADQKANLFFSDKAKQAADFFLNSDLNSIDDDIERALVRTFLFRYKNAVHTPEELIRQYNLIKADTMNAWKLARKKQDFQIFLPYLEKVFELKKQIALSIEPNKPAFDTLMSLNDEGANAEQISREFNVLSDGLKSLLNKIKSSDVKPSILSFEDTPTHMEAFARRLACESGYKESRGAFNNQVVHGFASFLGPRDSRISTPIHGRFDLIFTYLHEAGHSMYCSGGNDKVNNANLWGGIEGGFHEAMARFNENMIGRSYEYWQYYFPQLQAEFPAFNDISLDDFYLSMNAVNPSVKRISSDEVTYNLHVILRFEIERDYFLGKLDCCDIEKRWNELYKKYLDVCPENPTEGVLQDMHWAGDYIGYFQSYALGNIYSGQILQAINKDIPDFKSDIKTGRFDRLNDWLNENIRQYGCIYTASELAEKISGKSLDAKPFLDYLNNKYSKLYKLKDCDK